SSWQGMTSCDESLGDARSLEVPLPAGPPRRQAEWIRNRARPVAKFAHKPREARRHVGQHAVSGTVKVIDVAMAMRLIKVDGFGIFDLAQRQYSFLVGLCSIRR